MELQSCSNLVLHLIQGQFNMSYFSHESNFRLEGTDPQPEIRVIQSLSPLKALPTSSANHSLRRGAGQEGDGR